MCIYTNVYNIYTNVYNKVGIYTNFRNKIGSWRKNDKKYMKLVIRLYEQEIRINETIYL